MVLIADLFAITLSCMNCAMPALSTPPQNRQITGRQVIERIQKQVGVPWTDPTVDTFKAGDPDTPVKGIAVTMMATLDVLERAAASGKNLIITHEPTFYDHYDKTDALAAEGDPVYAAKAALIKKHGLVIWRFHDYWHRRNPDGIEVGMVKAVGWEKFVNPKDDHKFSIPETTLEGLASGIKKRLGIRTMRIVGDPKMKITKLGLAPGFAGFAFHKKLLQGEDVEVFVIGEAHEWETVEYMADVVSAKKRKALIILGHIPSEQAEMEECARWLKEFVTEVPVEFLATKEPFWGVK